MRVHISTENGIEEALQKAFEIVENRPITERTVYFNCTNSDSLRQAVQKGNFSWLQKKEKLENFHYQHVGDFSALYAFLQENQASQNLIIVEQLDHIVSQPSAAEYYQQNEKLTLALSGMEHVIFLDSWAYLDKYYVLPAANV